jgi:hypothetical protein
MRHSIQPEQKLGNPKRHQRHDGHGRQRGFHFRNYLFVTFAMSDVTTRTSELELVWMRPISAALREHPYAP